MLNFNQTMLNTENLKPLVDFYSKVFEKKPEFEMEGYAGFVVGAGFFGLGFHDKIHGKTPNPERVLFNFETKEVKEEFERISKIEGAEVVKEPYDMGGAWIATLADPDGNYFQLMTPWEEAEEEVKRAN